MSRLMYEELQWTLQMDSPHVWPKFAKFSDWSNLLFCETTPPRSAVGMKCRFRVRIQTLHPHRHMPTGQMQRLRSTGDRITRSLTISTVPKSGKSFSLKLSLYVKMCARFSAS